MTPFLKKLWFVPVLLLTGLVVACLSFNLLRDSGTQTDQELKTGFMKNRDSFSKLEQLFTNDPTLFGISSSESFRRIDGRISITKLTDNEQFISDQISIGSGSRDKVSDFDVIYFPQSMSKLEGGDFSQEFYEQKGYVLMLSPDDKAQNFLGVKKTYEGVEFRQLEQNWYIYQRTVVVKPE
jgi:hypothetical protein